MRLTHALLLAPIVFSTTDLAAQYRPLKAVTGTPRRQSVEAAALEFVRSQLDTSVTPKVLLLDTRRYIKIPKPNPSEISVALGTAFTRVYSQDSTGVIRSLMSPGQTELEDAARIALCRTNSVTNKCLRDGRYALVAFEYPNVAGDTATAELQVLTHLLTSAGSFVTRTFRMHLERQAGLWHVATFDLSGLSPKRDLTGPGPIAPTIEGAAIGFLRWYFQDPTYVFSIDPRRTPSAAGTTATDLATLAQPDLVDVQSPERIAECRADAEKAKCIRDGVPERLYYTLLTFSHPAISGTTATLRVDAFGTSVLREGWPVMGPTGRVARATGYYTLFLEKIGNQWRVVDHVQGDRRGVG